MTMQYNSAIQANPLMSQGDYAGHLARFQQPAGSFPMGQLPGMGGMVGSAAGSALLDQLTGNTANNNQRASLDFQRAYAPANSQFLLGAEQARANEGLQGGQYMLGRQQANYGRLGDMRNFLLNALMPSLTGSGGGLGGIFG